MELIYQNILRLFILFTVAHTNAAEKISQTFQDASTSKADKALISYLEMSREEFCKPKNVKKLKKLLGGERDTPNVNIVRYYGSPSNPFENSETILLKAVDYLRGDLELCRRIIALGADINFADADFGMTALNYASARGNVELLNVLLHRPAIKKSLNRSTKYGFSPLANAAAGGHFEAVKLLLEHNADPNHDERYPPLALAAGSDYLPYKDYENTAASGSRRRKIVDILILSGASLESSLDYRTPSEFARVSGYTKIADHLDSLTLGE